MIVPVIRSLYSTAIRAKAPSSPQETSTSPVETSLKTSSEITSEQAPTAKNLGRVASFTTKDSFVAGSISVKSSLTFSKSPFKLLSQLVASRVDVVGSLFLSTASPK